MKDNTIKAFFELVRAGLWEKEVSLSQFGDLNYSEMLRLAEEQSVVGLVTAGLEHVIDVKTPKETALQFVGQALQIEQRNLSMNSFIGGLVVSLRAEGISTFLVKGQGIAQCYERPLWRTSGDVDLLMNEPNYVKAKEFFMSIADSQKKELEEEKHQEFSIDSWIVEIHGNLPCRLFKRIDRVIETVQKDVFINKDIRCWRNKDTDIYLPGVNSDIIFVFTHILKHFFRGGIGLRQICDWTRLIWRYHSEIDERLLRNRLHAAGLMTEWKAFAAVAVDWLGMPVEAMPYYNPSRKWKRKAKRIVLFVLETGNFGHNRDLSYYSKHKLFIQKAISFWRHNCDILKYLLMFPLDSAKVWSCMLTEGVKEIKKMKRYEA